MQIADVTGSRVKPRTFGLPPSSIRGEVLRGLRQRQKELPPKLFYDERGSELFDQICELDEYYLTRTEIAILQKHIEEIGSLLGSNCLLIEYGSGSSQKTQLLLDHLENVTGYLAIDISKEPLLRSTARLASAYPGLEVIPIHADYTGYFELPSIHNPHVRRAAFFPGSTIGNFYPNEAVRFLARIAATVGSGGGLLIGVDLKKDPAILNLAYNDPAGVTAAFNLNMLAHINRELGADFQIEQFRHHAFCDESAGRIEMHLHSLKDQTVHLASDEILFQAGESILTEVSYKYTLSEFERLATQAGFQVRRVWTDDQQFFSVQYLVQPQTSSSEM